MTTPRRSRGKLLALWVAAIGLALLAVMAVALRVRISEQYYLWKLETGDGDEQVVAAERLGHVRSVRAVPGIVGLFRKEVASHLASDHRIIYTGNPKWQIGDRARRVMRALVDIGKPATLELLRVPMVSSADFYTIGVLQGIYADWERELAASGPPFLSYEILLRRLESDPTQPEEVRREAALAILRKRRSR